MSDPIKIAPAPEGKESTNPNHHSANVSFSLMIEGNLLPVPLPGQMIHYYLNPEDVVLVPTTHHVTEAATPERSPLPPNAPASMEYFDRTTESPELRALVEDAKRDFKTSFGGKIVSAWRKGSNR